MIFFAKVTTEKLRQPTDQITNPTRPDPTFKIFFFGFPTRPDIQNRWSVPTLVDDIRFNGTYENVYGFASERENIKNLDFYQILGNHDHRRNATAQVSLLRIINKNKLEF